MIQFKRDGTNAVCAVTIPVPTMDRRIYRFRFETGTEEYAALLTEAMRTEFRRIVQKSRKEAYEAGWRDAKARRRKQEYFAGYLGD